MTQNQENTAKDAKKYLSDMSQQDFRALGMNQIAYIREIEQTDGHFGLFSADGTKISEMNSYEEAIVASYAKKLDPVTVH